MKKKILQIIALLTAVLMLLVGCSSYGSYKLSRNRNGYEFPTETTPEDSIVSSEVPETTPTETVNSAYQLTEEDIQNMNGGNAVIIRNNDGIVTSIVGKYYDTPVTDYEDAITSLDGVASLIGLGNGSEFFAVYGAMDAQGYVYYTYQQKQGQLYVDNCTLKIVIDPDGYCCALFNSFEPNLGIVDSEVTVTAEEAEQIAINAHTDVTLNVMSEYTVQTIFTWANSSYKAYAIYSRNPYTDTDAAYLVSYVSTTGVYIIHYATNTLSDVSNGTYDPSEVFDGLEAATCSGTVTRADGVQLQINVPVAYDPSANCYYLIDLNRKIACADFYSMIYSGGTLSLVSSTNNQDWDVNLLIAYNYYIKAYDYYLAAGIESVDGFGVPIVVLNGYCDSEQNGVDNAGYCGIQYGWACFGVSSINTLSQSMDVVGHEYTHGITSSSMNGNIYCNETGAINEAYSDIMGNIIEMDLGETTDTEWLCAETAASTNRSLSNPYQFGDPIYVGDSNYWPTAYNPSSLNDNGGNHTNSLLLSHLCYQLNVNGLNYDQLFTLWLSSINVLTPKGDFDDVYAALIYACRVEGFTSYESFIGQYFSEHGMLGNLDENAMNFSRDGYGRVTFPVSQAVNENYLVLYLISYTNGNVYNMMPQQNGVVTVLVPADTYLVGLEYTDLTTESTVVLLYASGVWTADPYATSMLEVGNLAVVTLPDPS